MKARLSAAVVAAGAVLLMLTACDSGSSSSASTSASSVSNNSCAGASGKTQETAAAARIKSLDPANSNNKIVVQTAVPHAPAKGLNVWWLQGNIPVQQLSTPGFQQAAKAVGWNLHVLTYDFSDPDGAIAAMQQAVDANPKPDFIAVSGQSVSTLGQGYTAAKKAGIPIIEESGGGVKDVGGKSNDVYANVAGPAFQTVVNQAITDWVIADSGACAHVLYVNIPSSPVLAADQALVKARYAADCTSCSVRVLVTSFSDFGNGSIPSEVVSAIQSDPSINYIQTSYGDLADGLPAALKAAHINAKIVGTAGNLENLQSVAAGTSAAYTLVGQPEVAYAMVDAMVRISEGLPVDATSHDVVSTQIWATNDIPKPVALYNGAKDYQAQFAALWHVG